MAINQRLLPSDILFRRLDVLGIAQNVDVTEASTGKSFLIFNAGNIGYPSPSKRVVVAAIMVEFSVPVGVGPSGCFFYFGSNGSFDWVGAGQGIFPSDCGLIAPFIWFPQLPNGPTAYNPPVYATGQAFTATNHSVVVSSPALAKFTALGWAS